ncbi:tetratricopeptide repeat protein [[Phormidium] sp. ETS-05]|uniref:tetratricopeptide repeat protein n=1 Tax=[Phormidium] sp. ETS-05 TaxID=222819 RepID=UPI0018EF2F8C|nr:tetratricopeptide repeat protein [[Phormidium] sp. ETS-05]
MDVRIAQHGKAEGELEEAITRYQEILATEPGAAMVHHQLGEVYFSVRRLPEAIASIQQAIKLQPDLAAPYKTLGNVLLAAGNLDAAARSYAQAVALAPDWAEAHANLGSALYRLLQMEAAAECYQKAISLNPNLAGVWLNLGNLWRQQGQINQALDCWEQAITLNPQIGGPQLHIKMGNLLLARGDYPAATASYQQAVDLDPNSTAAYSNLGSARLYQGQFQEAITAFRQALQLNPNSAEVHCNLGLAITRHGQQQGQLSEATFNEACTCFRQAIEIQGDLFAAHQGIFYLLTTPYPGNFDFEILRKSADQYRLFCPPAYQLIATTAVMMTYLVSGYYREAKDIFLEIEQNFSQSEQLPDKEIIAQLIYSMLLFGAYRLRDDLKSNSRLSLLLGQIYADYLRETGFKTSPTENIVGWASPGDKNRNRLLKIGFISPNFWRHSVSWCSADVISELAQISPHIYFYYVPKKVKEDDMTARFKSIGTKFYRPNQAANGLAKVLVEEILQDDLDILVDIDSATEPLHAQILYGQPARACISWLGFEAPFISEQNYFLSDWHTHPQGVEKYYREKLLRMPDCFAAVAGFKSHSLNREAVRTAMRIGAEQVVYLCAAPATKLNPELVSAQIAVIKRVPDSVLIYKGRGDIQAIKSLYWTACEEQYVSAHRVKFLGITPTEEEHRTIYGIADVFLDSYPYNGGTHNLEALWFDLPVVTKVGEQFLARMGYSFLTTLGIAEGVAWSWEEYVEWGVKLGLDESLRHHLRERLRASKQPDNLAPLWNPRKFARDMYGIFEQLIND